MHGERLLPENARTSASGVVLMSFCNSGITSHGARPSTRNWSWACTASESPQTLTRECALSFVVDVVVAADAGVARDAVVEAECEELEHAANATTRTTAAPTRTPSPTLSRRS